MSILNKLIETRHLMKSTAKQKSLSVIFSILIGIALGLLAKIVDTPNSNPIFDDLGGRLGIWVFTATLLSVISPSPKMAAAKVFAFLGSMLSVYYLYTIYFLHFTPTKEIIFWGICAGVSPLCAYIMWYARGRGLFSNIIAALPISLLITEGFGLRHAYLPVHRHYYLIPWLMAIYLVMIVLLLLLIPKNKSQLFAIVSISAVLSVFAILFNVLGWIFGG
ncbi:hypothetical protein ACE6ED_22350 [Paenibacillus sp. CN-4]|uniref:hypothetical protein n=1 Tax=Paenibacillus nanchangensis TaxID=3348343 RepID=UPI003977FC2F